MAEYIERRHDHNGRHIGGWRVVASAWAIVLLFVLLLAGAHAVASLRGTPHPDDRLSGAVIPRHDPTCGGFDISSPDPTGGCAPVPFYRHQWAYW